MRDIMGDDIRKLIQTIKGSDVSPIDEGFHKVLCQYDSIRADLSDEDQLQVEAAIETRLQEYLNRLKLKLNGPTGNEQAIDQARKNLSEFAVHYRGSELGRHAESILALEVISQRPAIQTPKWVEEFRQRSNKIVSALDGELIQLISDLNSSRNDGDSQWPMTVGMELVRMIQGLMDTADLDREGVKHLNRLIKLGNAIQDSEVIGDCYSSCLVLAFDRVRTQFQFLKHRERFGELRHKWLEVLKENNWAEAERLVEQTVGLILLPKETHGVEDARLTIQQLKKIHKQTSEALEKFSHELDRFDWKEIEYRSNKIAEQLAVVSPHLVDLSCDSREKYRHLINRFIEKLRTLPALPKDLRQRAETAISGTPWDRGKMPCEIESILDAVHQCMSLHNALQYLQEKCNQYERDVGEILRERLEDLELEVSDLLKLADETEERRIREFFEQTRVEMLGPFKREIEDYLSRRGYGLTETDKYFILKTAKDLVSLERIANELASFDTWRSHREMNPSAEVFYIKYPNSVLIMTLEQRQAELNSISQQILDAEKCLIDGDLDRCNSIVNHLSDLSQNTRLRELKASLHLRSTIAKTREFMETEQFDAAETELRSIQDRLNADTYHEIEIELVKKRKGSKELNSLVQRANQDLSVQDLVEIARDIHSLTPLPNSANSLSKVESELTRISEMRAQDCFSRLETRICSSLNEEINRISALCISDNKLEDINIQIQDVNNVLDSVSKANDAEVSIAVVEQKAGDLLLSLKVQDAIGRKDFDSAKTLIAKQMGEKRFAGERQYLERKTGFQEALHLYSDKGNLDLLIKVLNEPWYGQEGIHISMEEMKNLCKDLLVAGRLSEVPAQLISLCGLDIFLTINSVLSQGNVHSYKRLVEKVKSMPPENNDSVQEGLNVLFQEDFMSENAPGLLFLWMGIPVHCQREINDGANLTKRLEQSVDQQIRSRVQILKDIQKKNDAEDDIVLEKDLAEIETIIHFFDEVEELQPSTYRDKRLGDWKNDAVSLYNKFQSIQRAQDQISSILKAEEWLCFPEILTDLRKTAMALPADMKLAGHLLQQVNELIDCRSRIDLGLSDLRDNLERGDFKRCIQCWEDMKGLYHSTKYEKYLEDKAESLLGQNSFRHWRQSYPQGQKGGSGFEKILFSLDKNARDTVRFVEGFWNIIQEESLDHSVLSTLLQDWNAESIRGIHPETDQLRKRMKDDFFPNGLVALFENEWPRVQTPMSEQAQRMLSELTRTEKFCTFRKAYEVIKE